MQLGAPNAEVSKASRAISVWFLCDECVVCVLSLCGFYVMSVWFMCDFCVILCDLYVMSVWFVCDFCVVSM